MILNHPNELLTRTTQRPRTVIVGSGAAGLYVARELSRRGQDIVVIESGGVKLGSFPPQSYLSVGRKHDGIRIGRSRTLGGTTNLWGGQLVEFQPIDFDGRDWLPGSKWPVTYHEIRPYYRKTYENLGIEEEAQDDARVLDHFLGSRYGLDEGLEIFLTRWLKIPSFAVAFAKEIQFSANPRVLLNHTAVGFRGFHGTITGIRVRGDTGEMHTIEGDRFILAAGTIEISKLLLHGAAAPDWECPWRHNANVGAYFQDHLGGWIASVHPENRKLFFDMFCTMLWSGHKFQPKVRLTNQALNRTRILNVHGAFRFDSLISENLVYAKQFAKAAIYSRSVFGVGDLVRNLKACGKYLLPLIWKYVVDNRIFVPNEAKISLIVQCEQAPMSNSRIRIDSTKIDATGLPKAILDWRTGFDELPSIRAFAYRCDSALRAAGVASLEIPGDLTNLDPRFLATLRDTNHQSGGVRMGLSERDGVVDRNLRVFGTQNLYVSGAATFRTNSGANTTFTALAFATRLIEHLTAGHAAH